PSAPMPRPAEASAHDPTKVVGTNTPAHRADAGLAWGTLVHGLLEHAMRHKAATRDDLRTLAMWLTVEGAPRGQRPATRDDLRTLAMWLTVEEPQLRTAIDEALDTVERAAHANFWQLA